MRLEFLLQSVAVENPSPIELLLKRRSVLAKDLTEPGPTEDQLHTILQAGIRVPDHGRAEPWRIQIVPRDGQRALSELFVEIYTRENPEAPQPLIEMERDRPLRSPVLLVVSSHPDPKKFAKVPHIEQLMSAGAVCENLLIAAQALGYGAQWLTGWPAYHPEVRTALGHTEETDIVGFIHIGTAAQTPRERPRPDFNRIVSEWPGPDIG